MHFGPFKWKEYIHYLSPTSKKSLYVGGGIGWGGLKRDYREHNVSNRLKFVGIIQNAIFGYEFFHQDSVLGFVELDISQPTFAVTRSGKFPRPVAQMSIGAGF